MERMVLHLGMFETLMVAVISIYCGEFLRNKIPLLKKYCLPASVVGGTLFSLLSLIFYYAHIFELSYDYKIINKLFYCIFFAASGASASFALLKKGGKLVVIFAVLAALLSFLQNALALTVGHFLHINPLISMMTGSVPLTGGHGNAAAFAPIAVDAGVSAAMEVAIASATCGLIVGSLIGGPIGNFIVKRHHFEDPLLDGKSATAASADQHSENVTGILVDKNNMMQAVFFMCIACGFGQVLFLILKYYNITFPIHVCCMFGGILIRMLLDLRSKKYDILYESIDIVGEFSLALFVSMSIVSMKLWQLAGLGGSLSVLLLAQVVLITVFCYFVSFNCLGRNYDAAIMAVGHTGFGLGAVPVSMTTMKTVCKKYRYSQLAFFVVPVIGGFISNITNAVIITKFLDFAKTLAGV